MAQLEIRHFNKQDAALSHARSFKGTHVFSYDKISPTNPGAKSYITTTNYNHFLAKMKADAHCHYHEVVPEDNRCNLYFDIDYKYKNDGSDLDNQFIENKDPIENAVHLIIVEAVSIYMKQTFPHVILRGEDSGAMVLHSHRHDKYSCHIIWRFQNACWRTNQDVKNWVCDMIRFFSNSNFAPFMALIDLGVYDRNRSLRTFMSTKRGDPPSTLMRQFESYPQLYGRYPYAENVIPYFGEMLSLSDEKLYELFEKTLICNVNTYYAKFELSYGKPLPLAGILSCHYLGAYSAPTLTTEEVSDIAVLEREFGHGCKFDKYSDRGGIVMLNTNTKWCPYDQRYHFKNKSFVVYNKSTKTARFACHDPDCKRKPRLEYMNVDDLRTINMPKLVKVEEMNEPFDFGEYDNNIFDTEFNITLKKRKTHHYDTSAPFCNNINTVNNNEPIATN